MGPVRGFIHFHLQAKSQIGEKYCHIVPNCFQKLLNRPVFLPLLDPSFVYFPKWADSTAFANFQLPESNAGKPHYGTLDLAILFAEYPKDRRRERRFVCKTAGKPQ
jgi:hypothetical protein